MKKRKKTLVKELHIYGAIIRSANILFIQASELRTWHSSQMIILTFGKNYFSQRWDWSRCVCDKRASSKNVVFSSILTTCLYSFIHEVYKLSGENLFSLGNNVSLFFFQIVSGRLHSGAIFSIMHLYAKFVVIWKQ